MRLEDVHDGEEVFIDSNIFTYLLVGDPRYMKSVNSFLKRIERGSIAGSFNLTVFDETLFNFIKAKAIKKYGVHWEGFNDLYKRNPDMVSEIDLEPVLKIFEMDNLSQITTSNLSLITKFSIKYSLLPADAINLAVMKMHNITSLASNDSDFERVDWIGLHKPEKE
jgi:predicted nucleic acid-binding protein